VTLVSPVLRNNFREFCVTHLVLRQIHDLFRMADIQHGTLRPNTPISGQRRILVEEYYATLNWTNKQDAEKFLKAVGYMFGRADLTPEIKKFLQDICEQEGFTVDGTRMSRRQHSPPSVPTLQPDLAELNTEFSKITDLQPQARGFAFEKFLSELFAVYGLSPRSAFRLVGEQIDGSFQLQSDTYLVEAKWEAKPTAQDDLLIFRGKVDSKSAWARGVFISISGFSDDGLTAFSRGRATNIFGMSGQDLYMILNGEISLPDAISRKVRRTVETGEFYVPVFSILRG
jgi:hypothetical protein